MMSSRGYLLKASVFVMHIQLLFSATTAESFNTELSRKYFTDVSMICDHPGLNVTARKDIRSLAWIFPNGETVDSARRPDPKLFRLTGPGPDLQAYNLTALSISDEVFGYYICVVVHASNETRISVIKWGLNVEGADFSELIQSYQENAIFGGIAAACMLVAIGAVCLLWHFRYSSRHRILALDWEDSTAENGVSLETGSCKQNEAYLTQDEVTEMEPTFEPNGRSPTEKSERM